MSTPTKKEIILAQCAAYVLGGQSSPDSKREAILAAERLYPVPQITRLRVLMEGCGVSWRVIEGNLQVSGNASLNQDATWRDVEIVIGATIVHLNPARMNQLTALMNNPTETVDDDS